MKFEKSTSLFILVFFLFQLSSCAAKKIPVILDQPPEEPYEVIQKIEVQTEWNALHWLWHWWHYMPWYSAIYKMHDQELIKKAQRVNADAIINVKYLPHRQGATAEAIRFKPTPPPPEASSSEAKKEE